ncbi:MAG: dihydrodipicolinate synthase family protein [Chitinispirillales bacterium]|jgi:4-hydroxy-tetrahydrodipicolinate synthase|nr:dihydrodipicolinate synthase family protein [Chitinispirillales bacterium]
MNEKSIFENLIAALVTPIKNFQIEEAALADHLEFLQKNGVNKILSGGTTGEFFSIGNSLRYKLFELTKKNFNGKIIFNVSDTSLSDVKKNIEFAQNSGADAIALIPPFYFANAPIEGIINFFNDAVNFSEIPCMLYNFTKHTQNKITPEIIKSVPQAAALKDSDKDETLITHTPCYVCGGDSLIYDFYRKGAKGVISVMANYCPKLAVKMWNQLQNSDFDDAKKTQEQICEIASHFRKDDQIARIKYALSRILNEYSPEVLPPLLPLDKFAKKEIDELFDKKILG